PNHMVVNAGLDILVAVGGGGGQGVAVDAVDLSGDRVSQVSLSVAVDDSVVDDVTLGQVIIRDDGRIISNSVDGIAIVHAGINSGELQLIVAVDVLDTGHGVNSLHDHVGNAVAVVIDDLQPVAVLVAVDVNTV